MLRRISPRLVRQSRSLWSYTHGISDSILQHLTIPEVLRQRARTDANKLAFAFRHQNIRKTYAEFSNDVDQLAAAFIALGYNPGDRVGIWSPSNYEWAVTQYATAASGLILVNVNPAYKAKELEYSLNKVGVKALVMPPRFRTNDYIASIGELCSDLGNQAADSVKFDGLPNLEHLIMIGKEEGHPEAFIAFDELVGMGTKESWKELESRGKKIMPDLAVNIQYTSGTTGQPKGSTLTHHNLLNNAYFIGVRMGYDKQVGVVDENGIVFEYPRQPPTICVQVPFYHCFGCGIGNLSSLLFAGTCLIPDEYFNPEESLHAIEQDRCDTLYGVPTMFSDILSHSKLDATDVSTVNRGIMAGSPCPAPLLRRCNEKLGMKVLIAYGSTELSPIVTSTLMSDDEELQLNTVGCVMPHTELKLVDADGRTVERGERGEVWARGYCVMLGYWNDGEKNNEVVTNDRWYRTG